MSRVFCRSECIVTKCHKVLRWAIIKAAVECRIFASTCFAYQQIITILGFIITSIPYIPVGVVFPTLRMVLYKRATVCVLVHPQFKHREHRSGVIIPRPVFYIRAGATESLRSKFTNIVVAPYGTVRR